MSVRQRLTQLFFEFGAPLYARKLSWGPEAALREDFVASLPLEPPGRALDVGCGPGYVAGHLRTRGAWVTAVDRSRRMVRWASAALRHKKVKGISFGVAPAEQLPFADATFDLTVATTLLYLLPDPRQALAEMRRVTRPGGLVATLDPAATMTVETMRNYAVRQRLTRREARQLTYWSRAAEWYGGFTEDALATLYCEVGLREVCFEQRLDGLVLIARAQVPTGQDRNE